MELDSWELLGQKASTHHHGVFQREEAEITYEVEVNVQSLVAMATPGVQSTRECGWMLGGMDGRGALGKADGT